ncbi:MAG: hypothetical protein LQ351_005958 [Letrouitia transgressa]|nr:MAG: hypothetical protein LQ351_005958 [Letrouitia transgressa]
MLSPVFDYFIISRCAAVVYLLGARIVNAGPTANQCAANTPISSWGSVGDSFANLVGDGGMDYMAQMERDPCLQGKKPQYLANEDSLISQITSQQVPKLKNVDLVTVSAGSNDLGLVGILDACVYNFIGSASLNCDSMLNNAAAFLGGDQFAQALNGMFKAIRTKIASRSGEAYVVGIPAFFDETTPRCSQTSLSAYAWSGQQKYLTNLVRAKLNVIIHRYNWWLHYLVTKYNRAQVPSGNTLQYPIKFIDADDRFNGHRFCRAGARATGSGDGTTWFADGGASKTSLTGSAYSAVSATQCNDNGGWNEYIQCRIHAAFKKAPFLQLTENTAKTPLKDWERVFHPTSAGHGSIKSEITSQMAQGNTLSGFELRILPLGASIVQGFRSSDGNGFRKVLYDTLRKTNKVSFVGSEGTAPLKHEGHPGWVINDITAVSDKSLPSRPNVVLVHAGTNDILQDKDIDKAPERLGNLIDHVLGTAKDAVVLVAQILPCSKPGAFDKFVTYNVRIANMLNQKQVAGKKVLKVWMPVTTDDLVDAIHPNDAGYHKMAQAWIKGLQRAADKGWIGKPV